MGFFPEERGVYEPNFLGGKRLDKAGSYVDPN